jgi:hypothetical protein
MMMMMMMAVQKSLRNPEHSLVKFFPLYYQFFIEKHFLQIYFKSSRGCSKLLNILSKF